MLSKVRGKISSQAKTKVRILAFSKVVKTLMIILCGELSKERAAYCLSHLKFGLVI